MNLNCILIDRAHLVWTVATGDGMAENIILYALIIVDHFRLAIPRVHSSRIVVTRHYSRHQRVRLSADTVGPYGVCPPANRSRHNLREKRSEIRQ